MQWLWRCMCVPFIIIRQTQPSIDCSCWGYGACAINFDYENDDALPLNQYFKGPFYLSLFINLCTPIVTFACQQTIFNELFNHTVLYARLVRLRSFNMLTTSRKVIKINVIRRRKSITLAIICCWAVNWLAAWILCEVDTGSISMQVYVVYH